MPKKLQKSNLIDQISNTIDLAVQKVFWWCYHYSGIRFIVEKFGIYAARCPYEKSPPSGMLWLFGIYFAAFGVASQQYVRAIEVESLIAASFDVRENRGSAETAPYCISAAEYEGVVAMVPYKPRPFSITSVWLSLFGGSVPSMNPTNKRARNLEMQAFIALIRSKGMNDLDGDFRDVPDPTQLKLDQPRTKQYVRVDDNGEETLVVWGYREPALLANLTTTGLLENCEYPTIIVSDEKSPLSQELTYACTTVILERACEESSGRSRLSEFSTAGKPIDRVDMGKLIDR